MMHSVSLPVTRLASCIAFGASIGVAAGACSGSSFNSSAGHDASADGFSGGASSGGSSTGGTDVGDASAGGSAGSPARTGGAGGVPEGGAGGGGAIGSGGAITADACSPVVWFPDGDGDKVGRSSGAITACIAPSSGAWVTLGGDCNDDNAAVHPANPDPPNYAPTGYTTSASTTSFDYDCDGVETGDPSQFGAAPDCSGLALGNCSGSGFVATARTGAGANAICGSTSLRTCKSNGVLCSGQLSTVEPKRCR